MTSRLGTIDLLEKRVRSRFGGRTVNVWPEDVWAKVLKRTLLAGLLPESTHEDAKQFNEAWTHEVENICSDEKALRFLEDSKATSNVVRTLYKTLVSILHIAKRGSEG
jgi:origin recognition complex subunit 4